MSIARAIIGALVGVQLFQLAEGVGAHSLLKSAEDEGVLFEFELPLVGKQTLLIRPPSSGGSSSSSSTATVSLGPQTQAKRAHMTRNALIAAAVGGGAAFFLSGLGERKRVERAVDRRMAEYDAEDEDDLEPL